MDEEALNNIVDGKYGTDFALKQLALMIKEVNEKVKKLEKSQSYKEKKYTTKKVTKK